jgi:tetratricopeptide (TPR) repeat protein
VHRLGQLTIEMGEFEKAEEVYKILFEKTATNDWEQLAHVHHQIGYIFKQKNDLIGSVLYLMKDYTTALSYYQKALKINQKSLLPSHPALARSHYNMATTLKDLGQFDKAIEHEIQARDIAPCISDSYLP